MSYQRCDGKRITFLKMLTPGPEVPSLLPCINILAELLLDCTGDKEIAQMSMLTILANYILRSVHNLVDWNVAKPQIIRTEI